MAKNEGKNMSEQQFYQQYADNIQKQRFDQEVQQQVNPGYRPGPVAQRNGMTPGMPSWTQKNLSPEARAYFSQPAEKCQMCGNGGLGQTGDPTKDEWELKWSVHNICAHAVWDQLDRAAGIASQRK